MRWRKLIEMICPTRKAEYFSGQDWTTQIALKSLEENRWTRGAGVDLFRRFVAFFSISLIAMAGSRLAPSFYLMFVAAVSIGLLLMVRRARYEFAGLFEAWRRNFDGQDQNAMAIARRA